MSLKSALIKAGKVSLVSVFGGVAGVLGVAEGVAYVTTGESAVLGEAVGTLASPLVISALAGAGMTGYLMGRWDGRAGAKPAASAAEAPAAAKPAEPKL